MAAVLVVIFLAAVSMYMERMLGWGFLILCFIVGSLGGLVVMRVRDRAVSNWKQLPTTKKRIAVTTGITLVLGATFIANRHKPDELANDALTCFAVVVVLVFFGLYRIMSRFLDALHARFSKR
jgi:hypothetical protein